jgi:hypothetical protein
VSVLREFRPLLSSRAVTDDWIHAGTTPILMETR